MNHRLLILVSILTLASCGKKVYLFTSFHEPANGGLRMLLSKDGYHWNELDTNMLKPLVGDKIMRDPSIARGPDGIFHLVWTCAWKGRSGFGHASSTDLTHWSSQDLVDVMKNEPTTVNIWAPEIFYDDDEKQFIIIWASTIPFRFAKGIEDEENNHRMYYVTTKDFKTYSDTKLFYDPGFSVIDCTIVKRGKQDFVLVLKDNTRPERNLKVAFAKSALGPYGKPSESFTAKLTEGPSVAKVGKKYIIYYDNYGIKKYGAAETSDFKSFTDISGKIQIPEGHKHGTIIRTTIRYRKLRSATKSTALLVPPPTFEEPERKLVRADILPTTQIKNPLPGGLGMGFKSTRKKAIPNQKNS